MVDMMIPHTRDKIMPYLAKINLLGFPCVTGRQNDWKQTQ